MRDFANDQGRGRTFHGKISRQIREWRHEPLTRSNSSSGGIRAFVYTHSVHAHPRDSQTGPGRPDCIIIIPHGLFNSSATPPQDMFRRTAFPHSRKSAVESRALSPPNPRFHPDSIRARLAQTGSGSAVVSPRSQNAHGIAQFDSSPETPPSSQPPSNALRTNSKKPVRRRKAATPRGHGDCCRPQRTRGWAGLCADAPERPPSPPVLQQLSPCSASSCARCDAVAWMITGSGTHTNTNSSSGGEVCGRRPLPGNAALVGVHAGGGGLPKLFRSISDSRLRPLSECRSRPCKQLSSQIFSAS